MTLPTLREVDYQRQITDLAELLGYEWAHFRPAQTARGWRTPVSGPIGAGFPDLILARPRDGRLLAVECKARGRKVTPEQRHVLDLLARGGAECYVWTAGTDDLDAIAEVLR